MRDVRVTRRIGATPGSLACSMWLAALAGTPACSQTVPSAAVPVTLPTSAASGEAPVRRPDGVLLDMPPLLPPPVARTPARGVVALREPAGQDALAAFVESFIDAWQRQSLESLLALAAPDAGLTDGPDHGHAALVESWRQRLKAHDYGRLAGAAVLLPERIERWDWDALDAPATPGRPQGMRPGEILVRVPLEVTRVAGDRVFGDVIVMVLTRRDGAFRISAYGEADSP